MRSTRLVRAGVLRTVALQAAGAGEELVGLA
jgi:hypothetical protein